MATIIKLIPREAKGIIDTMAKILPNVPMIVSNKDGSLQYKVTGENENEKIVLANHKEELPAMFRKGGWPKVNLYVKATYQIADSFYGLNMIYHRLIPYKRMTNAEIDLNIGDEFEEQGKKYRIICGKKIQQMEDGSNRDMVRILLKL